MINMIEFEPKHVAKFFSKIKKVDNCWIWMGYKNKDGYGRFAIKNTKIYAHRFSYELFKQDISKILEIDHLCRNRKCVNPQHLEAVTHKENIMRGSSFSAKNKIKNNCPQGHQYNKENTYRNPFTRKRFCRICNKLAQRKFKQNEG